MRNKLFLLFMVCVSLLAAQAPKLINYQGVARGNDGLPVLDVSIGIKFEILRTSATGSVVYTETQSTKTNSLGLILTQIGLKADLSTINWQNGPYFLRVSVDFDNGTNYVALGVQQIMAVPYSMYAQNVPANYNPSTNRLDVGGNSFTLNSAPNTTITPQGVVSMTNAGTNNFIISVPASSISVTSTVGAAGVSTTGVNAFNINIPAAQTTTVRGVGAAVVSPTVGTNFTVTVPQTSLVQSGAAQITGVGTNTFNVHVPQTSLVQSGAAQITGVGTNTFTVHVPQTQLTQSGAAQVTSGGTNTFNVHVPQTQITQSGAAQVTSSGSNTFNVHVPQTNVVATSTSGVFAFNSPGTNSFNINVPSPTLQATGLASSNSVGNLHTINVPIPTYAQGTGVLNFGTNAVNITPTVGLSTLVLNVGPATNSVNLTSISPWKQAVGSVTLGSLTDKVGIGTSTPIENLQLQSTGSASASILSGNSNISSLMFGTNASHGSGRINYDNSNNTMSLWTNNVANRLFIDPNGNIGLGNNAPVSKLDVSGNLRLNTGTNIDKIMFGTVNGVNDGYTGIYGNNSSLTFAVYKPGAPATGFGSQNTFDAMFIEHTTGRVGLGTNTPAENLAVHSQTDAAVSIISSASSSQLYFGSPSNHSIGRVSYDLANNTMHLATNNTPRIFINSAGNVGLSNTNPGTRLEVTGDISIPSGNRIVFGTQSSGFGTGDWIQNSGSGLQFNTANVSRMTINNLGNVGINTPNPQAQLHVNGMIRTGSETTGQPPNYPGGGLVIRRVIQNTWPVPTGAVIARTDGLTFETDGTNGGFRIVNAQSFGGNETCECMGVTSAGLFLNKSFILPLGTTQIYVDTENVTFLHCMFGDPFNAGHTTEISIHRYPGDYYWMGTVTSTQNQ